MTKVQFNDEGSRLYIKASGHATGSVEMCAAISALLLAFDEYLKGWGEMHTTKRGDGELEIECNASLQTVGAYRMVERALTILAKENPQYLQIMGGGNLSKDI